MWRKKRTEYVQGETEGVGRKKMEGMIRETKSDVESGCTGKDGLCMWREKWRVDVEGDVEVAG